jgi:hypothetical protein
MTTATWSGKKVVAAAVLSAALLFGASLAWAGSNGNGGGLRDKSRFGRTDASGDPSDDAKPADPSGRSEASLPKPPDKAPKSASKKPFEDDSAIFKTPAPSTAAHRSAAPARPVGGAVYPTGPVKAAAPVKASPGGIPYIPLYPLDRPTTRPTTQPTTRPTTKSSAAPPPLPAIYNKLK